MRILSGNLEVAVVAEADMGAARNYLAALILELEHMRSLLDIRI